MQRHLIPVSLAAAFLCAGAAGAALQRAPEPLFIARADAGPSAGALRTAPAPSAIAMPRFTVRAPAAGWVARAGGAPTWSTPSLMRVQGGVGGSVATGPSGATRAKARSSGAGTDRTTINENGDDGNYTIVLEGDTVVSAKVNGETVPADRIVRDGDVIHILDANGQGIHDIRLATAPGAYAFGGPPRVRIGVTMDDVGEALAAQLGLEHDTAVVITSVTDDGPAAKAGLEPYDVVTAIDGDSPVTTEALAKAVRSKNPGDTLKLHVLRKGKEKDIAVTVEKYEPAGGGGWGIGTDFPRNLTPDQRQRLADIQQRALEAAEMARVRGAEAADRARAEVERTFERLRATKMHELSERLQEAFDERLHELDLHLDDNTMQKIEEALRHAADSLSNLNFDFDFNMPKMELFDQNGQGRVLVLPPTPAPTPRAPLAPPPPPAAGATPAPPATGNAPGADSRMTARNREPDDRFKSLEKRMDRLESLLEKLVEQQDNQSKPRRSN